MSNAAATAQPDSFSDSSLCEAEKLGSKITELCSYSYALEYRLLTLIREFDEKEHWARLGMHSCAHWLNYKCGIGMNAAREKVRVARALAGLPRISARFEQGKLSFSKVRAMTRIADEKNEDYLLMIAKHGTAHHVEKLVSKARTVQRLQDAELADENYRNRELSHYYDHDGCLVIKARMPADQGALIIKALEKAMDENVTAETPDDDAELEPIAARRADALADMAQAYLNNNESSGSAADRYQVVVHVKDDLAEIDDGPHVTAETSRRIACDCSIIGVKVDHDGEPLAIGRRSRSIPPAIRRALHIRDKGCRFPGCTNTRNLHGHHIKHWADGGETNLDELVLLCPHHHHLVHEGGFTCEKDENGMVVFRNPRNERLHRSAKLPGAPDKEELQRWIDREFFEMGIDSESCTAKWYAGDRMDWDMAVSALFN